MKQVLQKYETGKLQSADVPAPAVKPNTLLVRHMLNNAGRNQALKILLQGKARGGTERKAKWTAFLSRGIMSVSRSVAILFR